ncbi:MAG: galactonate dehydratase [Dehalococcoidia bacterium]
MKITNITSYVTDSIGNNIIFVKTETDEGLTGWGEAYCVRPDLGVAATIDYLKDWLIDQDPRNIESLWAEMYQGLRFPPGSIGLAAISGIEHTLWDISAQALGLPVHKMLGGNVRDKIRVYQGVHGNTPEKTAEHAQQLIEKYGYTGLKMSPYPPEPDKQLWNVVLRDGPRFIEAVRDAVGDDIDIGLDAHAKIFEPIRALELADAMAPYKPYFFEEPIRPENIQAMAYLRRKMTIPLATGECLYTKFEFNELMQAQAADIIQPDVCICGGLMEMRKIAAIAEGHDVMVAPHNPMGPIATAINVHFAAATYNFSILEFVPHDEGRRSEFVREPWVPKDGYLDIPDKPGWGIEVNESALSKYPYQSYRRGNPRRSDGSPAFI